MASEKHKGPGVVFGWSLPSDDGRCTGREISLFFAFIFSQRGHSALGIEDCLESPASLAGKLVLCSLDVDPRGFLGCYAIGISSAKNRPRDVIGPRHLVGWLGENRWSWRWERQASSLLKLTKPKRPRGHKTARGGNISLALPR